MNGPTSVGRFLSEDPLRGSPDDPFSTQGFVYANSNPTRFTDPTGREVGFHVFSFGERTFGDVHEKCRAGDATSCSLEHIRNSEMGAACGFPIIGQMLCGALAIATSEKSDSGIDPSTGNITNDSDLLPVIPGRIGLLAISAKSVIDYGNIDRQKDEILDRIALSATSMPTLEGEAELGELQWRLDELGTQSTLIMENGLGMAMGHLSGLGSGHGELADPLEHAATALAQRDADNLLETAAQASNSTMVVGPHGKMPSPHPGQESHHGVMSAWMEDNYSNYSSYRAPAILMSTEAHRSTTKIFEIWKRGSPYLDGAGIDWRRVPEAEMRSLAEQQMDAAGVSTATRNDYWSQFMVYQSSLKKGP